VHRNRLIAGLSLGTLVVEAGARSGALITAGAAVELGRELWAVPGDPRRPTCRGNNRLLRDGAAAVLDAGDLLAACGLAQTQGSVAGCEPVEPRGLGPVERRVWQSLAVHGPADVETLSRRTRAPVAGLLEALSLLELAGRIARDGEGYRLENGR
jgi:DNA processing protein